MAKRRDHSFVVYIDESGDEGFKFKNGNRNGSSEWFVVSAAVFRADTEPQNVKVLDIARAALGYSAKKSLHFRDLSHEKRVVYCQHIATARMRALNVMVHKPSVSARKIFRKKSLLYNYASKMLLERVSWLCRDRIADTSRDKVLGDGSARIVFSNRRTMSYTDFQGYLRVLFAQPSTCGIHWPSIDVESVESHPHGALRGLQIADAVASAFFFAVEPHPLGIKEPRYAKELEKVVYQRGTKYRGYGVKLWPSVVENALGDLYQ